MRKPVKKIDGVDISDEAQASKHLWYGFYFRDRNFQAFIAEKQYKFGASWMIKEVEVFEENQWKPFHEFEAPENEETARVMSHLVCIHWHRIDVQWADKFRTRHTIIPKGKPRCRPKKSRYQQWLPG